MEVFGGDRIHQRSAEGKGKIRSGAGQIGV